MNTINKQQQFYKTNPTMLYLNSLPDRQGNVNRGYKFRGESRRCPYVNILWGQIDREYEEAGLKEFQIYTHLDADMNELTDENKFQSHIYIHTGIGSTRAPRIEYTVNFADTSERVYFTPNSNREITKQLVIDLVIQHYKQYFLFPQGLFRSIQNVFLLSKKGAIKKHRWIHKNYIPDYDRHEDVLEYIFDKFNIEVPYGEFCDEDKVYSYCKKWVEKFGKPEETMYLKRFRPLYLLDGFDGDIDEVENLFHEYMDNVPNNVILI